MDVFGIGSAIGGALDLVGDFVNWGANSNLQTKANDFTREESARNRSFTAQQNQINRDWQTEANRVAWARSHYEAQLQRDWEEEMSSTAMQRRVTDLRQAGLNPILAAHSLGGADTPSGATASGLPLHLVRHLTLPLMVLLSQLTLVTSRTLQIISTHI